MILAGSQVKTAEYPPFEKGGRGGFKKVASAATVNPPQSPFYKGGGFAFMRFNLTGY